MTRIFAYLGRFAAILLGFAVAALAASAFLHLLVTGAAGLPAEDVTAVFAGPAMVSVPFVALFVAYFAFVPALFAILAAEMLALRGWLYHALAGGAVGVAAAGMVFLPRPPAATDTGFDTAFGAAIFGAGIVGGIAYWLVAGRFSGGWRRRLSCSRP